MKFLILFQTGTILYNAQFINEKEKKILIEDRCTFQRKSFTEIEYK